MIFFAVNVVVAFVVVVIADAAVVAGVAVAVAVVIAVAAVVVVVSPLGIMDPYELSILFLSSEQSAAEESAINEFRSCRKENKAETVYDNTTFRFFK